jgi:anti-anti-sigma factor
VQPTLSTSADGRTAVLRCHGDVDLAARVELAASLAELALEEATRLVVDLTGTTFLDVGSVGVLEDFAGSLDDDRLLVLACPPGIVRRVLALTDFDQSYRVVPTLGDALTGSGPGPGDPSAWRGPSGVRPSR